MDCHEVVPTSRNDASPLPSLRGRSPKQSIESCEAQPLLAPLRGAEKEEKGGRSASALLELEADKARLSPKSEKAAAFLCVGERGGGAALFAKKSDCINENISIESRRSERVENAESLNKSNDSIELNHNMDCHEFNKLNSRNDGQGRLRRIPPRHCDGAKQSIKTANFYSKTQNLLQNHKGNPKRFQLLLNSLPFLQNLQC